MKSGSPGNSLEQELVQSIQGYSGYQLTENRGRSDKRLREYLSTKIKEIEGSFQKISERTSRNGYAETTDTINKLKRQLKHFTDALNKPSYHNSPFFSHSHLDADMLSQLYEYEAQIKNHLLILTDEVSDFENSEDISESGEFLNHLFDVIDNMNQILMEREFLLAGGNSVLV